MFYIILAFLSAIELKGKNAPKGTSKFFPLRHCKGRKNQNYRVPSLQGVPICLDFYPLLGFFGSYFKGKDVANWTTVSH